MFPSIVACQSPIFYVASHPDAGAAETIVRAPHTSRPARRPRIAATATNEHIAAVGRWMEGRTGTRNKTNYALRNALVIV